MNEAPILPGPRRGLCLVISAPSGAGKTTLVRALRAADPSLGVSISATTRAPRPGETDGVEYLFHSEPAFAALERSGALLEAAGVFGRRYGTPRKPVEQALAAAQDMVFDIDWQGHRSLRAALPRDTVSVFVLPPSLAALRARLVGRGDAAALIDQRMAAAEAEITHWPEFDHVIVNDRMEHALAALQAILLAARSAVARRVQTSRGLAPAPLA